jgi:dipeptidyl aminopeptidase/acylaminoacyl peptidase
VWTATLSGRQYPVIDNDSRPWRWLADSSGVAFLQWNYEGGYAKQQLSLADLRQRKVDLLMSSPEYVKAFDVRSRQNYVYVVANHDEWEKKERKEPQAASFVGTGVEFWRVFFPNDPMIQGYATPSTKELWAVVNGERFQVKHDGKTPDFREEAMSLSPDGMWLATLAAVGKAPASWEKLYPAPPFNEYSNPIRAGGSGVVQYVRMNLRSGSVEPLVDAPMLDAIGLGIGSGDAPVWSSDGQKVLLPRTFVKSKENVPSYPCIAISDLRAHASRCVVKLRVRGYSKNESWTNENPGTEWIDNVHFSGEDNHRVAATFYNRDGTLGVTRQYQERPDDTWQTVGESTGEIGPDGLEVKVTETFKEPPLLVAKRKDTSRVIWDPNPQLRDIELADVSIYKWKDTEGRQWEGGLFKPLNYEQGKRYPLVIQTHGFLEKSFTPSGYSGSASAAQELAAQGILVLQTAYGDQDVDCKMDTPEEAPCMVGLIESAAKQLVAEGLADPENIGIVGFSRTCYYVMDMLTTNTLHLKAASITDGVMADYASYVLFSNDEFEKMIGAKPYGEGLQQWIKRSPSFNLEKVNAPLLITGLGGRVGAITMWAPYAELHHLKKPVEFIVINTVSEHVLTNPGARMASQGGSVDWFRFWLQDYEDPDRTKVEQYERWRGLKQMQAENEKKSRGSRADSN